MHPTMRQLIPALVILCLALAGCNSGPPPSTPPPPKVTVAHPEVRQIVDTDDFNGRLEAAKTVEVRARVRGHIEKIHFKDGEIVKKDQELIDLDSRPFQAEVDQAKAKLKVYEAQKVAAEKDYARLVELEKKGGASKKQVEKAEADVKSYDAQIDATQEEIKRRKLDLEYAKITAPISGRIGEPQLREGNLVNAGGSDQLLATIRSIDPINLYFPVDERSLKTYAKNLGIADKDMTRMLADIKKKKGKFTFALESEEDFTHEGTLDFVDNRIDPTTGTIRVRGEVDNKSGMFTPGARARVRLPIGKEHKELVVPDSAIQADQNRRYLLVVGPDKIVKRLDVKVDPKLLKDGMRVVTPAKQGETLQTTDQVIVEGLQTARINYPVEPMEAQKSDGKGKK